MNQSFCKLLLLLIVLVNFSCSEKLNKDVKEISIIPVPQEITKKQGVFKFDNQTKFIVANDSQIEVVSILTDKLKRAAGISAEIVKKTPKSNYVQLITNDKMEKEAYIIDVNRDNILIQASNNSGFIYGIQTLRQLLPNEIESNKTVRGGVWQIPNVLIKDKPRFKWRGLMLDVSRHFFDKEYVKETIDRLSMHKMNILHLHLIDDQGWRIEIKKYPKLTEIGAWRVDQEDKHWQSRRAVKPEEKGTYGGFFTQEDLKEIVSYADKRGVEIIPEIEMPAHVSSGIASYPHLSCNEKPIGVPSGGLWPITDIYCAGKESTFEFLEDVLTEVMEIFPSKYIHIGGDEATKTNWATCKHCKKRIKDEKLKDVEELQSYFIKRIEKFLNANGKKLIGWDEILEGGLAPDATVMSWRGVKGGIEAAKLGHDVVMSPTGYCYFDYYQGPQNQEPLAWGGFTPLSKVYQFEPVVETMTQDEAKHVLGGQANLWSEYIPTTSQSEYMIYPRVAALSETLWSSKEHRNWDDFSRRIREMFKRYDLLGINYSKSSYLVSPKTTANIEEKTVELSLQSEFPDSDIRFALNDEELNENSPKFSTPIKIKNTTRIKASLFKDNKQFGRIFTDTILFHQAVAKKVTYNTTYSDKYQGAGEHSLVDALRGTNNFHDGKWQGWLNKDMEVVIDLETVSKINQVSVGTMEAQTSGIFFPTSITVLVSNDGNSFREVGNVKRAFKENSSSVLKTFKIDTGSQSARYVKILATKGGAWLFVDEILIQ